MSYHFVCVSVTKIQEIEVLLFLDYKSCDFYIT
jgi:hypothetical protein